MKLARIIRSSVARSTAPIIKTSIRHYARPWRKPDEITEAYRIIHPFAKESKVLITCEHGSNRIPEPWTQEEHLKELHWGYDIGSEAIATSLAAKIGAPALLARFGRLLIDVNRKLDSDTLCRDVADGKPVALNTTITPEDKQKRIDMFWKPYRDAFARLLTEYDPDLILSVHSYTPNYEGKQREVEIGVLYQQNKDLAEVMNQHFVDAGYDSRLNEPWHGDICDILTVAHKSKRKGIVIEFKQDLALMPRWKSKVETQVMLALQKAEILE